jgi:predicted RNase H-like HicB family nuclease
MVVRVRYVERDGHWSAESPDVPELFAGGASIDEARDQVRGAVELMFETQHVEIVEEPWTSIGTASELLSTGAQTVATGSFAFFAEVHEPIIVHADA